MKKLDDIMFDYLDRISGLNTDKPKEESILSGYSELDKYIKGFHNSDLIIISGKIIRGDCGIEGFSFALNLALNITMKNKKCLFISPEYLSVQIAIRILSIQTGIDYKKLLSGNLTNDEWVNLLRTSQKLNEVRLYIEDKVPITVSEIEQKVKELKGVDCIIIDYLQLMSAESKKEKWADELKEIMQHLKSMAGELNVPVICCARGYVGCEGEEYRPNLTLFRKRIGEIDQFADIVLFVYRDDYYSIQLDEEGSEENHLHNTELIIAKNRYGKSDVSVDFVFDDKSLRFLQLSKEDK